MNSPVNYHKYLGDDIAVYPPCYQRHPLRSITLRFITLVPLEEGQCSAGQRERQ